ncbi:MAG: hypothetical protein RIS94_976 [Pseudomonadota bacterium]|jgi:polysaccharide pyruvyl transferase WcaK-like protein
MKIALLNVKYSPNLGDGLLAECLERELERALPGAQVFSIDLAGRRAWPLPGPSRRARAIALLEALPQWARRAAVRLALALLVRLRLRRHVARRLHGCDAVVVGGGNLLTDADLNFPMKLAGALAETRRRRLPVAVHAVGASRAWSPSGRALFARALGAVPLAWVSLRDSRSQQAWADQLESAGLPPARLARDPGLLASRHWPAAPPPPDGPRAGLCITAPMALRYHADGPPAPDNLAAWYGDAARALVEEGFTVALFTNGSPEDRAYLAHHGPGWIAQARGPVTLTNPFADPAALAGFISTCALVVAHRMHACIAAHSYGIPTIGLSWDVKLNSFFDLAGRANFIAETHCCPPEALRALVRRAMATGVDPAARDRLIAEARADVAAMATRLAHHAARPAPRPATSPLPQKAHA